MTIEEYWSADADKAQQEAANRKLEQLKLQGQKELMDARHAISEAESNRDAYITALKNKANPCFSNIVEHFNEVAKRRAEFANLQTQFNTLFGE